MEKSITYFSKCSNLDITRITNTTVNLALERAKELDIKHVVIASVTGRSAIALVDTIKKEDVKDVKVVVVGAHFGFYKPNESGFEEENLKKLKEIDIPVIFSTHALSGVARSIRHRFRGVESAEIMSEALRRFCQGIKVCVEISVMAADAGEIPVSKEVMVIGGTDRGVDTAVVLEAANMQNIIDPKKGIKIKEIICMPRERS